MRLGEWVEHRLVLLRLDEVDLARAAGVRTDAVELVLKDDTLNGIEPEARRAVAVLLQVPFRQLESLWLEKIDTIPDEVRAGPNAPPPRPKSTDPLDQKAGIAWVGQVVAVSAKAHYEEDWDPVHGGRLPVRVRGRRQVYALNLPREFLVFQLLQPAELHGFASAGGGHAVLQFGDVRDWEAIFGFVSVPSGDGVDHVRLRITTTHDGPADDAAEVDKETGEVTGDAGEEVAATEEPVELEERWKVPLTAIARVSKLLRRIPRDVDGKVDLKAVEEDFRMEVVQRSTGRYMVEDDSAQAPSEDMADVEVQAPPEPVAA